MMGAIIGLPLMLLAIKFKFLVPKYVWTAGDLKDLPIQSDITVPQWKAWLPYAALAVILLISRMPTLPIKNLIAAAPGLCLPELFHAPGTAVKWNLIGNP